MKQKTRERTKRLAKALNFAASAALVLGMAPTAAIAEGLQGTKVVSETPIAGLTADQIKDGFQASPAHVVKGSDGSYSVVDDSTDDLGSGVATRAALPEKFDLRDADLDGDGVNENYVTRVKNQGAFGTCWAFGTTAAAEASLVAELGLGTPAGTVNDNLDLSEKHLAWFTYQQLPDEAGLSDAYHQAGEGMTAVDKSKYPDSGYVMNPGGAIAYGTTMYSGLMGPTLEKDFPYANAEGTYKLPVNHQDDDSYGVPDPDGDWSLPAEDRFAASYAELEQSFYLPSPAQWDATDDPSVKEYRYSETAVDLIKNQLLNGRAVGITYCADTAQPGQPIDPTYINLDTWSHYTNVSHNMGSEYSSAAADHAVCIVGYDDTYSKENFLEGKQPPADGAFIVKNSWGASDNDRPNKGDWGLNGTGYFYLSYYDRSLENPEAFDFVTKNDTDLQYGKEPYYEVGRYLYDFLPSHASTKNTYGDGTQVTSQGNIFDVKGPAVIRTLSTKTDSYDTDVTYDLYRLNEGATTPTDGELVWSKTVEYETGGYHRIELDEPVTVDYNGERFGVVVTTQLPDGTYETMNHTAFNQTFSDLMYATSVGQSKIAYGTAVVNEGESFIGSPKSVKTLEDGTTTNGDYTWVDLSEIIADKQDAAEQEMEAANVPALIAQGKEAADEMAALNAQYTKDDGTVDEENPDYQAAMDKIGSKAMEAVYGLGQYMNTMSTTDELQSNFALQAVDNNPIGLTAEPGWDDVYRLYNAETGEHLYTTDVNEYNTLVADGWKAEESGWQAPDKNFSDTPIYRLHNPFTGEHLYTTDKNEYDTLVTAGWDGEDVKLYSLGTDGKPIYRLYNPYNQGVGAHMYTTSTVERDAAINAGWQDESIAFYGWN